MKPESELPILLKKPKNDLIPFVIGAKGDYWITKQVETITKIDFPIVEVDVII